MKRTLWFTAGLSALVVLALLALATVLSLSNATSWTDLEVGDCLDLAGMVDASEGDVAAVANVDTIACTEPHDAEVVGIGELDPDGDREYPPDAELFVELDQACAGLVPAIVDAGRFGIVPIGPDARTWDERAGRFVCLAVVRGGGTVTRSALVASDTTP